MEKVKLIILFALFCVKTEGFSILEEQFQNDIIRIYWSPRKDTKIEIYSKGQAQFGKFVWLKSSKIEGWVGISLFGHTGKFELITKK